MIFFVIVYLTQQIGAAQLPDGMHFIDRPAAEAHGGATLSLRGKAPMQWVSFGHYEYGWWWFFNAGENEQARIVEMYSPAIFSFASSDTNNNTIVAARDRLDRADISIQADADEGYGYLVVGSVEGALKRGAHHRMGLRILVDDGEQYLNPITIEPDGTITSGQKQAFTGYIPPGAGVVVENGIVVGSGP